MRAEKAEKEIANLLAEFATLEKCQSREGPDEAEVPEELEKLQLENKKLKYRLGILQRAVGEMASVNKRPKVSMPSDDKTSMPSIAALLIDTFRAAVGRAFPDLGPNLPCPVTTSTQADYQFNGAMAIAGILKV